MRSLLKGGWRLSVAAAGLLVVAGAGAVFWKASSALSEAARRVAEENEIRYRSLRLDGSLPAGIEWISAPSVLNDATLFQGHLVLAGATGLLVFDSNGKRVGQYRAGRELPPAELVSLATGVAADSDASELFIATAGAGLLAFNGSSFRQILPDDSAYRDLTAVLPLSTGRILLGTAKNGVLVYQGKHLRRFHPRLSDVRVTALAGDEGNLWIGTLDRGVIEWRAGELEQFTEADGLPDRQVLSLTLRGDSAYVGTPLGVAEFESGRFHRVLASGFFARALLARGNELEVGTVDEGTLEVPLSAERAGSSRPRGYEFPAEVHRLLASGSGLYALGQDGLYSLDTRAGGSGRVPLETDALLTDRNISALAFDSSGRLWVGYFDRGLDILAPGAASATHVENDHVFCVNRIVSDAQRDQVMVGTANGLALFDAAGRLRQVLGRAEGLIADHVTDVALSRDGLTIATPAGITLMTPSGTRSLYAFHGLVSNHVYSLASSAGRMLVGTLGGVSLLEGGEVRANYTTSNSGLKHNWVTAIVRVGDDWFVGTYGGGVLLLDASGRWQSFSDLPDSLDVNPNAMTVSSTRVYAGSRGRGLLVYNRVRGRWTTFTAGLPSSNVTAVAVNNGYLYAGTDNGLVRVSEQDMGIP